MNRIGLGKYKLLALISVSLGLLGTVEATAADSSWYAGISYGSTKIDSGVSGTTGSASLDEEDTGYKLLVGKKINKNISIEGFYADFGEVSLTGNTGDTFVLDGQTYQFTTNAANVTASATGVGLNGKYSFVITQKSSFAARVGVLSWDIEGTVSGASISTSKTSQKGTDLFYGIGYQYDLTNSVAVTADYDSYKADDDKFTVFAIGLAFSF